MVSYSRVTASPKYPERAGTSVPRLEKSNLRLPALGTDVSSNVRIQGQLAGNSPRVDFSSGTQQRQQRRASVPRSIDIARPSPPSYSRSNLGSFGQSLSNTAMFQEGGAFEFIGRTRGIFEGFGNTFRESLGIKKPKAKIT